jgi:hypothetical protein
MQLTRKKGGETMPFQLDFFGNHDMPEEMLVVERAAASYPWSELREALEPRFRQAAVQLHSRGTAGQPADGTGPEGARLFDFTPPRAEPQPVPEYSAPGGIVAFFRKRNPKGAGRKPQPFLAYLKAFLLAPVLYTEPDCTRLEQTLRTNPYFLSICGFSSPPDKRTLQDFDQIMREAGLWDDLAVRTFDRNVKGGIIDRAKEDTINVDPTDLPADSTPGRKQKSCRECKYIQTCPHPQLIDPTAGWYQKSSYKGSHAHMLCFSQLAHSGAPFAFVVLNGKSGESNSLEPLLRKGAEVHPDFDIRHVNADGIFNTAPSRQAVKAVYPDANLHSPVHAGRRKEIEDVARGVEKITPKGTVICEAGHAMVLLGQDRRTDSYCFACPVYNPKARRSLEKTQAPTPPSTCSCKNICSPTSTQGRFVRIPRALLPQLDSALPQGSYRFWRYYHLRTKIERLFGRLKERFLMKIYSLRGQLSIEALASKLCATLHVLAFVTGTYGV